MKHYLKPDGTIWAFELDGSQDELITGDMVQLNPQQLAGARQAQQEQMKDPVMAALLEQQP